MTMASRLDTSLHEEAANLPVKVCMHVLGTARTDVRVLREATALVEAGFAVTIVDIESERGRPVEEYLLGIRLKHVIMPEAFVPARFKPWFLVKLTLMIIRSTILLLRSKADIYHAHVERTLPACYIAAQLRRKPLIFDAAELPLSDPSVRGWRRLSTLSAYFLAWMLPRCAGVITVSPPIAQEIQTRYRVREVILLRNVPVYRTVTKTDRLRQYLGLGPQVRIALYQGNLQPNRGLHLLVHAARYLEPDIVIALMGRGMGTTRGELEALIAREGVSERVKILPPALYEELLDWTASADIGLSLLPPDYSLSIRWCLPNKLFEYLMAGLPVLSSPLEAVTEVLTTYDVGQIAPSLAPADVGTAINTMLADREALAHMRANALQVARQEFNWEKEKSQLLRLYHDILERGVQHTKRKIRSSTSNPSPVLKQEV